MVTIIVHLAMLLTGVFLVIRYSDPVILIIPFLSLVSLGTVFFHRRGINKNAEGAEKTLLKQEVSDLKDKLSAASEKNNSLETECTKNEDVQKKKNIVLASLADSLQLLNAAAPILEALSKRVIEKAEASNMSVSDRIFSIAEHSKYLGGEIQNVLTELMDGSGGLESSLARLEHETGGYRTLISGLKEISGTYLKDMDLLKQAVQNIGSYTQGLTDLADQTNLLSINASIEAARAGSAGGGFRIIASEVQALARRSKAIADEINTQIVAAASNVESSFSHQELILGDSISRIEESQSNLDKLVTELRPQLESIGNTVEESKKISTGVTDDLNQIIVSMQYHDMIRQILEHCNSILNEVRSFCNEQTLLSRYTEQDEELVKQRVRDLATKYFTVDDEWEVLGISVRDSTRHKEREKIKKEHKLEGDITLF